MSTTSINLSKRARRNRKSEALRSLIRETTLTPGDLIAPLFIIEGHGVQEEIKSMPGVFRYSEDLLLKEIKELYSNGVSAICLFPKISDNLKNKNATESYNPDGLYIRTISEIKAKIPEIAIMTDIALDPYSSDGHDGIVSDSGEILNDQTLEILGKMALVQAHAGADILGPSDMMDGRVGYIRACLENEGFKNTTIMSYTAKYASNFYGPFREALSSTPSLGDKKSYQMDFHNSKEALIEAQLDEEEGADILMVKPGLSYLDIIAKLKESSNLPIAAYNVSGEYSMVKAAALKGWIDGEAVAHEILVSFKRAGADMILTYFAKEISKKLNKE